MMLADCAEGWVVFRIVRRSLWHGVYVFPQLTADDFRCGMLGLFFIHTNICLGQAIENSIISQ